MSRTYSWNDTYCPKGHGDWVFVPASTLYSDIYWCEKCNSFYYPKVAPMTAERLNKDYSSDRAGDLIKRAKFIKWKSELQPKDMPQPEEVNV